MNQENPLLVLYHNTKSKSRDMLNRTNTWRLILQKYPIITLIPSLIIVLSVWWIPPPEGLTVDAIHLLAIFLG
jgi:hypothetical protein